MPMRNDLEHYAARERQARMLAEAATDPRIKQIHLDMAERYAVRLNGTESKPMVERHMGLEQS